MVNHRNAFRKLGRTSSHRWALLRTMVSQLIEHERIETTVAKAKELRRVADNMVTLGKEGTLHARRQAAAVVRGDEHVFKLFNDFAERYKEREGGYTRVLQTRDRKDSAPMAYIEFVDRPGELVAAQPPRQQPEQRPAYWPFPFSRPRIPDPAHDKPPPPPPKMGAKMKKNSK
ncbi:mitochondrial ribosomal protein L17 precursor [Klebsormidium nitens]|uniref:Large ribosomal subunit protein bL17c n=1 Tax=Klebsormidium nitens TaxID=105231 RepID=A0A0U9HKW5_KLENI|nr:mitochondrial ribosomal protein L17 precursor [Klebsormidium nitens]|eukprot:GAQ85464.1 mitochondrial ribosomal protein L17 precursor [Klebsormidium nitens]